MHRIELVSEIEPMFMIHRKIHLTWENPGPIDVDLATYTEVEKNQIRNAINRNAIKVKNLNPEVKVEAKPTDKTSTSGEPSKKAIAKTLLEEAALLRQKKIDGASKTLRAPVHSILEFIESTGDIAYVKEMQLQEAQGKARPVILEAVKKKLAGFNNILSGIIGEALDEKSIQIDKQADAFTIEEEIGEEVEINLGADKE
jgi:hypothetical protein